MPLERGKSKGAFKHNIKAEMHAGKPMKQSLAIAYAMKKKARKMAEGGHVHGDPHTTGVDAEHMARGYQSNEEHEHDRHDQMGKPMMASGGQIEDNYQSPSTAGHQTHMGDVDDQDSDPIMHPGNDVKYDDAAMAEDDRKLGEHGEYEEGPQGVWMADGGDTPSAWDSFKKGMPGLFPTPSPSSGSSSPPPSNPDPHKLDPNKTKDFNKTAGFAEGGFIGSHQSKEHEMDMVGRIMKQRQQMYSEGGKVANYGQGLSDMDHMADADQNEFDDLSLRDDLAFSYTGKNSGDELDDDRENKDRSDIVSRIMKSRAKKDRLPNPR